MAGEIWIDPAQERVVRLAGSLQQDKNFGWGVLGELDKGGWVEIEQADVGGHQWRIVHLQLKMNGRVLWKTKNSDSVQDYSQFSPVPARAELQTGDPDAARRCGSRRSSQPVEDQAETKRPHPNADEADFGFLVRALIHLDQNDDQGEEGEGLDEGQAENQEDHQPPRAPGLRASASQAEAVALP